jgi:hypothetical protein
MTYQPRFSDLRVQRRIRRAIGFVRGTMSTTQPHAWSTRYIDQWFGQSQNPLSRYLRDQLLIVTKHHWNKDTGECKEYLLNQSGLDQLTTAIGLTNNYPIVLQVAQDQFQTELDSGAFVYNDQSSRLWHPLQNWRRDAKRQILDHSGYQYHYDIECCAMTLIHQHSQRIPEIVLNGRWQQGPMDLYLFALRDYLRDRTGIREQIAHEVEIDPDLVKRVITALLAGARLSTNRESQIYQLLSGDIARIRFLQQHEYLTQLRADIRVMWDYIRPTMSRRSRTQPNGKQRMMPISSRQKWGVYFDLERQVLNEIREFLCERGIRHFLEHDGWSCDREIDLTELQERILERTGFQLEFEMK